MTLVFGSLGNLEIDISAGKIDITGSSVFDLMLEVVKLAGSTMRIDIDFVIGGVAERELAS